MRNSFVLRTLCLALLLVLGAHSAPAYDNIRFNNGAIASLNPGSTLMRIRVPASGTLQDGTTYATSVRQAMLDWNAQLGRMQFLPVIESSGAGDEDNSVIEVFFSSTIYGSTFGSSTLAVTLTSGYLRSDGTGALYGCDVIFNSAYTWNSYRGGQQSAQDIRRVAIHEFGHVLGLDHPDQAVPMQNVQAIMNSTVSSIDSLQPDDIAGGRSLYGPPGSATPPANDLFANATPITLTSATQTFSGSSVHAFKEAGEPFHGSGEPGGSSVWWKWTAPVNGTLKVTTRNSTFDTMLAAYTGSTLGALNQIATNDDEQAPGSVPEAQRIRTSIVTINVTAGTTYHFAVDGWASEQGSVFLNLELTSRPVITSNPASQHVMVGDSVTFTADAFGSGVMSYQWRKGGTAIQGATGSSFTIASAAPGDAGSYDVMVTNAQGSTTSSAATLNVGKIAQSINFSLPTSMTYTANPISLNASATSGLPVSFSIISGPATVTGDQLTLSGAGSITIAAAQAGDALFDPAPTVTRTVQVNGTSQYVTFNFPEEIEYSFTPITLHATASSGLPITYTVLSGPATVAGNQLTTTGIGDVQLRARQEGNSAVLPAEAVVSFGISRIEQSFRFVNMPAQLTFTPAPIEMTLSARFDSPFDFTVQSGPGEIVDGKLVLTGAGTVVVWAKQVPLSEFHLAETMGWVVEVAPAAAEITLGTETLVYDGTPRARSYATQPAGLAVELRYNGSLTPPTNAGTYAVSATISDPRYTGSAIGTLTIAKATQTIAFAELLDVAFTTTPLTLVASASSGLAVAFEITSGAASVSGDALTLLGTGPVTVRATQLGNMNYEAATAVERTFDVATTFTSWRLDHFTAGELNDLAISGPHADPDADGLANLIEYALGLRPREADASPSFTLTLTQNGGLYEFAYLRLSERADVTCLVQASADLVSWSDAGITHQQSGMEDGRQRWVATAAAGAGPVFFRLKVSRAE